MSNTSVTIRLQNLPLSATASDIRAFFTGLRIPDGAVHIIGGDNGDAFIGFASDEDARQAMSRTGGRIHGAEVRLLLSSKTEMGEILSRAKSGKLSRPPMNKPSTATGTRWGPPQEKPSRFTPDSNHNQPAYAKIEPKIAPEPNYSRVAPPNIPAYQTNYAQKEERSAYPPIYGGLRQPTVRQMNYGEIETTYEASPAYKSPAYQQKETDYKGYGYTAVEEKKSDMRPPIEPDAHSFKEPPSHIRPHGMSTGRHPFSNGLVSEQPPRDPAPRRDEPPRQYNDSRYAQQDYQPRQSRFESERPQERYPPQWDNREPPRDSFSNRREPASATDSWRATPSAEQPWRGENRPPSGQFERELERRPFGGSQRFDGPPPTGRNVPGNFGPRGGFEDRAKPVPILRFLELTRLPPDMLRPAALESYLRPSQPFSVSAVKVVFNPQGIHLATLLRIENEEDFNRIMTKDGDQGIRIRSTTRGVFEEAVDGFPQDFSRVERRPPSRGDTKPSSRERSPDRRRKSRSRSPARRRKSRSRSPHRRRRFSRSPIRRSGRQDPNRWCLALTNVPFKIEPEEILAWLSERVKPTKLTRTFYADGNASDRWVAEFESQSTMERARNHRIPLNGRQIRFAYIDNDYADEILAIEDKYGESKKKEYDLKQMAELQLQHLNGTIGPHGVPRFFNNPASSVPATVQQQHYPPQGPGRQNFNATNGHTGLLGNCPTSPNKPVRGGFFGSRGRGRGFSTVPYNGPPGYAKRGRFESEGEGRRYELEGEKNGEREMLASVGAPGTVVVCSGFPADFFHSDFLQFFSDYPVDPQSVQIKQTENGLSTGDAMLAITDPEAARDAVSRLNGKELKGMKVHITLPSF